MTVQVTIDELLRQPFSPKWLEVINASRRHAGHHHVHDGREEDVDGDGETQFCVRVTSSSIAGKIQLHHKRVMNA